ncbi:MAG: DUF1194 domain-containing protein [Hyphomicrobium sp.]|nr:DUF1194 domain-containing protein [Hyphomicrobium sp.]
MRNISAAAAVTLLSALFGAGIAAAQDGAAVDTALIVAVDVSNSVDDNRYRLQMEGIAQALEDPAVIEGIIGGAKGGILFSMVTWADRPKFTLPWMRITNAEEARATAARVRKLPRQDGEFTCMARMMRNVSDKIVPQVPAQATKIVLDVSGDGPDNCNAEEPIDVARDELVKWGVTVNGLPILERAQGQSAPPVDSYIPQQRRTSSLEDWYRKNVKGGPGSFVLLANGYKDFGRAIRQKFVLEISGISPPSDGQSAHRSSTLAVVQRRRLIVQSGFVLPNARSEAAHFARTD